jgi:hypothetical protein
MRVESEDVITTSRSFPLTVRCRRPVPRLWYLGEMPVRIRRASIIPSFACMLERQLDGARSADLVERVEAAIGAAGPKGVRQGPRRTAEQPPQGWATAV